MEKLIRALSRPMLGDSCMSLDSDPFKKMAATIKDPQRIVEIRESEIPVPWCDDFGKMISGMKSATPTEHTDHTMSNSIPLL